MVFNIYGDIIKNIIEVMIFNKILCNINLTESLTNYYDVLNAYSVFSAYVEI